MESLGEKYARSIEFLSSMKVKIQTKAPPQVQRLNITAKWSSRKNYKHICTKSLMRLVVELFFLFRALHQYKQYQVATVDFEFHLQGELRVVTVNLSIKHWTEQSVHSIRHFTESLRSILDFFKFDNEVIKQRLQNFLEKVKGCEKAQKYFEQLSNDKYLMQFSVLESLQNQTIQFQAISNILPCQQSSHFSEFLSHFVKISNEQGSTEKYFINIEQRKVSFRMHFHQKFKKFQMQYDQFLFSAKADQKQYLILTVFEKRLNGTQFRIIKMIDYLIVFKLIFLFSNKNIGEQSEMLIHYLKIMNTVSQPPQPGQTQKMFFKELPYS